MQNKLLFEYWLLDFFKLHLNLIYGIYYFMKTEVISLLKMKGEVGIAGKLLILNDMGTRRNWIGKQIAISDTS